MPEALTIGHATTGQSHVSATGIDVDNLKGMSLAYRGPDRTVPADGEIIYEVGRLLYPLLPEGETTTATLKNVVGAEDGTLIVLVADDPDRPITIADDQGPDDDGTTGILVCGGDFTLRDGDVFACKYIAAIQRWVEVGRIWASQSITDLEYPPLSRARLHEIADRTPALRRPSSTTLYEMPVFFSTNGSRLIGGDLQWSKWGDGHFEVMNLAADAVVRFANSPLDSTNWIGREHIALLAVDTEITF